MMSVSAQPTSDDLSPQHTTNINVLAQEAASLGHDIVDIAGFLDKIDKDSQRQRGLMTLAQTSTRRVMDANAAVTQSAQAVIESADEAMKAVGSSVNRVRNAGLRTKDVAAWVQALDSRMGAIEASLTSVQKSNAQITTIARQVNMLAINAKIEAARAGDSGRGFSVVAEAINDLSQKTAAAADSIQANIRDLSGGISVLRSEAGTVSDDARAVLDEAGETDIALAEISSSMQGTTKVAQDITRHAQDVEAASREFGPVFNDIATGFQETVNGIHEARKRVNALIDSSERIAQVSVAGGAETPDRAYIDQVQSIATKIGAAFEQGIRRGDVTQDILFDQRYQPIPATNPQQVMAPFTIFTDKVLPQLQDAVLDHDDSVVFCASVDRNGYLPTHNRKFSQTQRDDPVWNVANCRNRRIFDDRVGLKAGRSTAPFLLQVYRRDMGGGQFVMMKDLSAPIVVNGRHWGGVRIAYQF